MIKEVYEALIEAGTSAEKASEAAIAVGNYDIRSNSLETRVAQICSEQAVIRWIVTFNLAFTMAIVWKTFTQPLLCYFALPLHYMDVIVTTANPTAAVLVNFDDRPHLRTDTDTKVRAAKTAAHRIRK